MSNYKNACQDTYQFGKYLLIHYESQPKTIITEQKSKRPPQTSEDEQENTLHKEQQTLGGEHQTSENEQEK